MDHGMVGCGIDMIDMGWGVEVVVICVCLIHMLWLVVVDCLMLFDVLVACHASGLRPRSTLALYSSNFF